jgi:hypothetical protein
MRAKAIAAVLALAAIAGASLAPSAGAQSPRSRTFTAKPEILESFSVEGSHGYAFTVEIRDRHTLEVSTGKFVAGPSIAAVGATYTVPYHQAPGSDSIETKVGGLGRIDVSFLPESRKKVHPENSNCTGGKTLVEEGHFVGRISFDGDGGYTHVHTGKAKGVIVETPALTCPAGERPISEKALAKELERVREDAEPQPDSEIESVGLRARTDGGRVGFKANLLRFKGKKKSTALISFTATGARHRGAVKEKSTAVSAFAPGRTFLVPDFLHPTTEATIQPGAPFTGSATFHREPGGPASWHGDLAIDLPGFGKIRLAGKGVKASMCETLLCRGLL